MGHSSVHLHVFFLNYGLSKITVNSQSLFHCCVCAPLISLKMTIFVPRSRFYDFPGELTAEVVDSALRVLGKLVQTFTGEKLVGHTGQRQPGFKAYARQHQTQCASRSGLSLKHAKSFAILTAFAQKNAASKPYHSYYAHSPTTHSGF